MSGFDRIKPPDRRLLDRAQGGEAGGRRADPAGRAALFSAGVRPDAATAAGAALGLVLHCSRCRRTSALDVPTALRSAFPLFLVAPWRRHHVFAVCPACRRRAWLRLAADEAAGR